MGDAFTHGETAREALAGTPVSSISRVNATAWGPFEQVDDQTTVVFSPGGAVCRKVVGSNSFAFVAALTFHWAFESNVQLPWSST
jgi:hypothetical protein